MSTIHANITDAERHEVKHASGASANQVLLANGDGTTRFDVMSYANLANVPNPVGAHQILQGSSSATSQQPTSTNTSLQVEFGAGGSSGDGSVTLSSAGQLTFNTAGDYLITVMLQIGRTDTTGNAIIFSRLMYNGAQILQSNCCVLSAAAQTDPFYWTFTVRAAAADSLAVQILRDAAGTNAGGLLRTTTSASGWAASPSASILVSRVST